MLRCKLAVVAAFVLTPWVSAWGQVFPADDAYVAWPCQGGVMIDAVGDESGAIKERDLVGDVAAPAGLRAADPGYLYVRLRVDADPPIGPARSWGLLVDTDSEATTYEVMLAADGGAQTVSIYRNTSSTPGDARDAPDTPALVVNTWAERARTVVAPGSSFGTTDDFFVDLAFSWTDLAQVGIAPATPVRVWAATSSAASNGMTGDFACWTGLTDVALDSTWPQTVSDPVQDSDGDGFSDATEIESGTNPHDVGSYPVEPELAGGGGCGHGPGGALTLGAILALATWARRRAR